MLASLLRKVVFDNLFLYVVQYYSPGSLKIGVCDHLHNSGQTPQALLIKCAKVLKSLILLDPVQRYWFLPACSVTFLNALWPVFPVFQGALNFPAAGNECSTMPNKPYLATISSRLAPPAEELSYLLSASLSLWYLSRLVKDFQSNWFQGIPANSASNLLGDFL